MANRNSKRKADEIAKTMAANRGHNVPPARKNNPKKFDTYKHFTGYRKPKREEPLAKVYKEATH